jgi:ribosome-associated protein
VERLRELVLAALRPPKPRRPTAPTRTAREARIEGKKRRGVLKRLRGESGSEE